MEAYLLATLQLCLGLDSLQYWLQLEGLHNVSLELQFARHKQSLRVRLAQYKVTKVLVGEVERN